MQHYVALVHGKAGAYGISFPDFPGCVSAGDTVDHALRSGIEALHLHMEGMIEDDAAIPAPRTVDAIRADPHFSDDLRDAVVAMVPVVPPAGKPIRLNVSLDAPLVVEIDAAAERMGQTRSGFLAEGARRMLTGRWAVGRVSRTGAIAATTGRDLKPKTSAPSTKVLKVVRNPDGEVVRRPARRLWSRKRPAAGDK